MKLLYFYGRKRGLTLPELLVVIAVLAILAFLLFPLLAAMKRQTNRDNCIENLKQVNLSFIIWERDNNKNKYPTQISVTNGGAMELVATGNVAACFSVMSYELSTPKILICPADTSHVWVTNFDGNFNNSHISYFVSPDVADETNANMILIGDDNLAINGVALNSGIVELSTQFSWTKKRHDHAGNIGYGDGSVAEISDDGLDEAASLATKSGTNVLINRIAIP